jgi:WD40 repeat protein
MQSAEHYENIESEISLKSAGKNEEGSWLTSPNGKYLIKTQSGKLTLSKLVHEAETTVLKELHTFEHGAIGTEVSFSSDSKHLATVGLFREGGSGIYISYLSFFEINQDEKLVRTGWKREEVATEGQAYSIHYVTDSDSLVIMQNPVTVIIFNSQNPEVNLLKSSHPFGIAKVDYIKYEENGHIVATLVDDESFKLWPVPSQPRPDLYLGSQSSPTFYSAAQDAAVPKQDTEDNARFPHPPSLK